MANLIQSRGDVYGVKEQRARSDATIAKNKKMFDLQAQDNTPKSARPHFAVVTHNSDQFRENFDNIDWSK